MKKTILLPVFLFFLGTSSLLASLPIPSYNIPVYYRANFQEKVSDKTQKAGTKGRRQINVSITCSTKGQGNCQASTWIYSLDRRDIYGPFVSYSDTTIHQEIDDREWGAYVESNDHVIVDIWIDEGGSNLFQGNNTGNIPEKYSGYNQNGIIFK